MLRAPWNIRIRIRTHDGRRDRDAVEPLVIHGRLQVPGCARKASRQGAASVAVYRFDAPLYFPNVPFFVARVRALVDRAPSGLRWLVVNAEAVTYIDATAVDALSELHTELADRGVVLAFARPKASMRRVFADTGLTAQVGEEHLFPSVRAAAAAFQEAAGTG